MSALSPARGAALVMAGAVLWGTTGTSQALGPATADPLAVGTTRLVLGGALLVAWAAARRLLAGAPPQPRAGWRGRELILPAVAGAVGVAAYQLSFFAAVDTAGVALGTAVAIGSSPIFTGLIEWALDRRRPSGRWWVATAVASTGVAVLAGPSRLVPAGVVLALTAGASYAVYAIASKRLLDAGLDGPTAMAVVFGAGGVLLVPALLTADLRWVVSARGAGMLLWLAAGTILLAYLLFAAGLAAIPASTAATLSLAEPLTAAVLGLAVLGEHVSAPGFGGAALVLAGLIVLLGRRRVPDGVPAPG